MSLTRKLLVAKVGEIAIGHTKAFRFGIAQGIAYNDKGVIKAFVNKCTHMGGPVELKKAADQPVFRCRWHEAEFNPSTGAALKGEAPAGSMLTPISLTIEGDQIFATLELPPDPFAF
jgi:nitrite reductase/ring-hydroxylating ferredoxin subunit